MFMAVSHLLGSFLFGMTIFGLVLLFLSISEGALASEHPTYEEVEIELLRLNQTYPELAALYPLTTTWENHTLWALRISNEEHVNESWEWYSPEPDPAMLFLAAQHGDEPQGVNLTLELGRRLLEGYGTDLETTLLVDQRDIWLIPVANPDGYMRQQRKNGQDGDGDGTRESKEGVDLNRNFGYHWGVDSHTSDSTTSRFYHGLAPFSEPESQALRNLSLDLNFSMALSYHSGISNPVFYSPWGYDEVPLAYPANATYARLGENLSLLTGYLQGPANEPNLGGYIAKGDLVDWLHANLSTIAWTVELAEQMTTNETTNNLAAAFYLLAQPWRNETRGPLEDIKDIEYPDIWINEATLGNVAQAGNQMTISPGQRVDLLLSVIFSKFYLWPSENISFNLQLMDPVNDLTLHQEFWNLSFQGSPTALYPLQFNWGSFGQGTVHLVLTVDWNDRVLEHNESNNRYKFELTIFEPARTSLEEEGASQSLLMAILVAGGLGMAMLMFVFGRMRG